MVFVFSWSPLALHGMQARRFRTAIADAGTGAAFDEVMASAASAGFPINGGLEPPLKNELLARA